MVMEDFIGDVNDQEIAHLITEKYITKEYRLLPAQKRFDLSYFSIAILGSFPLEKRQVILNTLYENIDSFYQGEIDTEYDDLLKEHLDMTSLSLLFHYLINKKYPHNFTLNDDLNQMLQSVDIFDTLPCEFLQLPFKNCFIEFGTSRKTDLTIGSRQDNKEYPLEGIYLMETPFDRADDLNSINTKDFNLKPDRAGRIISIIIVGSPVVGSNILDDTYLTQDLFIQEENESVKNMLQRNNKGARITGFKKGGDVDFFSTQQDSMDKIVRHLVTALLYIMSSDCRQEIKNDYTDMETKIRSVGQKKKAKLKRKLTKLYDKVIITSKSLSELDESEKQLFELEEQQKGNKKQKHLRRAHLRNQACGSGHQDRKIIFIKPSIVNPTSEEPAKQPIYDVR